MLSLSCNLVCCMSWIKTFCCVFQYCTVWKETWRSWVHPFYPDNYALNFEKMYIFDNSVSGDFPLNILFIIFQHTNDPTASHVQAYGLMVFMPAPGSNPSPIDRVQAPELNQSPMDESQVQESNPAPTDPSQAQELNTPPIDRSQTQGSSPTPDQSVVPN